MKRGPKPRALFDRIIGHMRVSAPFDCWIWTASTDSTGYGRIDGKAVHRVVYEELIAPIPHRLELDHLCRRRRCFHPNHVEPVTRSTNVKRGLGPLRNRRRKRCPQGHRYDKKNTYVWRGWRGPIRYCRTCLRARTRVWNRKHYVKQTHRRQNAVTQTKERHHARS